MGYLKFKCEALESFCLDAFVKFGFTAEESRIITDVLLLSDLYGIESHGMQRLVRYHKTIAKGMVKVEAKPEVVLKPPSQPLLMLTTVWDSLRVTKQ